MDQGEPSATQAYYWPENIEQSMEQDEPFALRFQINIDTILFSNRQFDSFFDTIHTVIGVTLAHA